MLVLDHVTKCFGQRKIFDAISYQFEAGKVYALVGHSGSGKTTLLNMLAKLDGYDEGEIIYKGKPLSHLTSTGFFRQELGYLFQNFDLLDSQTIQENLDLAFVGQKLKKAEKLKQSKQALQKVGLEYLDLKTKIFELSGGEAQRVALAKVILKNPPLILADEPTAALDPETSKDIMNILLSLKGQDRLIIIATHNPMIWEMADEVVKIEML